MKKHGHALLSDGDNWTSESFSSSAIKIGSITDGPYMM